MEYSEKVIDHYTNPRNVGKIENASGVGEVGNPVCGDIMKIFITTFFNIFILGNDIAVERNRLQLSAWQGGEPFNLRTS